MPSRLSLSPVGSLRSTEPARAFALLWTRLYFPRRRISPRPVAEAVSESVWETCPCPSKLWMVGCPEVAVRSMVDVSSQPELYVDDRNRGADVQTIGDAVIRIEHRRIGFDLERNL